MEKIEKMRNEIGVLQETFCYKYKCKNCPFNDGVRHLCPLVKVKQYLRKINNICDEIREPTPLLHENDIPVIKNTCLKRLSCGITKYKNEEKPCPFAYYNNEFQTYMCKFFSSDGKLPCDW